MSKMNRQLLWYISKFIVKNFYLNNVFIEVKGNIPNNAAIIVANHDHAWDPPLIMWALNRIVHFFTSEILFKVQPRKWFLNQIEQIPVISGNQTLNKKAFDIAKSYLNKNEPVGIFPFPQDIITKKRRKYTGVINLIIENDVPIIPVKVKIFEKLSAKSYYDVNFDKALIIIGKPIKNFRNRCKKGMSKKRYLYLTNELMSIVNNLKC